MSWTAGLPQERWREPERFAYLREIYRRLKFGSFTWDAPNVPANSTVDTTLTTAEAAVLDGLRAGMSIKVTPPSTLDAGLTVEEWVEDDDTLTIRLANCTGGAINPASGDWAFHGVVI